MRTSYFTSAVLIACAGLTLGSQAVMSREPAPAGTVPVHMVVTVEARHGTEVPEIKREDVTVRQRKERLQVTDWLPLRGEHAGLELFVLLDDCLNLPQFMFGKSCASFIKHGRQPILCFSIVSLDMNMRRFGCIRGIEVKSIRTDTKHARHIFYAL